MKKEFEHLSLPGTGYAIRGETAPHSNGSVFRHGLGKGFVIVILLLVGVACASPSGNMNQNGAGRDTAGEIVRDYNTWAPMFETVQNFSIRLMVLCRMMTDDEKAYLESEHGQHYVQVYANPPAQAMMRLEGKRTFPQGAVIVKAKLVQDLETANANRSVKPAGLGIMIKREPGFDTEGGNWEYLYVDETGVINRDQKQLEHCRACHMANRESDAIFYPKLFEE